MRLKAKKVLNKVWVMGLRLWVLALCLIQMQAVSAHAVVTDYSLKLHPIQVHKADKIELTFNSKVELGLSQMFLVSKGDNHTPLTLTAGNGQGQVDVSIPALEAGEYALKFKVFAADGHLTEDLIHFSVAQ